MGHRMFPADTYRFGDGGPPVPSVDTGACMSEVVFDGVTKRFGEVTAVDQLTLSVQDGEFMVLLGPSGCGKTTALRMIAGLETVTDGELRIGDRVVNDVEAKDRDIAMVFQSYALYPHMTVRQEHRVAPRRPGSSRSTAAPPRKLTADERSERVQQAATSLGLTELLDRKPAALSGGQRQRVALARAMVARPAAFLMDEPLSNLDAKLRAQTRIELVELHQRLATTFVYVTHDQVEAMTMADRIAVMSEGRLLQVGPPQAVYDRPHNLFVARFIGSPPMNTVPGTVVRDAAAAPRCSLGGQTIDIEPVTAEPLAEGTSVIIGVRPEHLVVDPDGQVTAEVRAVEWLGHERLVVCDLAGHQITIRQSSGAEAVAPGDGAHPGRRPRPRAPLRPGHDGAPQLSRRLRESLLGLALLVPSAIIFVWFFFYPLYRLFVMGLYQPNRTGTAERYVGWGQYSDVLTGDQFTEGVKITFTYVLYTVPLGLVLGVLLAVRRQPPPQGHQGLPVHLLVRPSPPRWRWRR